MKKSIFQGFISLQSKCFYRNLLITIACFLFTILPVYAAGGIGGMPLSPLDSNNPNWFMYNLNLGQSYDDVLVIKNTTDKEWIVNIYPADTVPSSGGGFALKQKVEEMKEVGKWIKLSVDQVRLKAGEKTNVPFTITIPSDADVGETAGAILFERQEVTEGADAKSNEGGIKLTLRTGVRIYNTVPGEIKEKLALTSFLITPKEKEDKQRYYLMQSRVENLGNVSTTARSVILVKDALTGKEIDNRETNFLIGRGTVFDNNQELIKFPKIGKLNAKLDIYMKLKDGSEKFVDSAETSFFIIPVLEVSIGLALLLILIIWFVLRRIKYSGKGWVSYIIKDSDDIMKIAAVHSVNWKTLTKVNKIKPPYFVNSGTKILVPKKK